ncbi:MAG TPA: radical SAM protein [Planctomycetaceae bacterium]|nr:radical SAM protein [Blastopirellula sp.]HAY81849.1 radical SAM protein [Planctomycetaceae bacterium]|tara:strand:- start:282 stop:1241 length:960 start_codon:yes stop_codon:yes gene_type:complete
MTGSQPLSADILQLRGPKNDVSPQIPYAFSCEPERSHAGNIVDVATVFLTNRECPFQCLMCDLWKNTLDASVPVGAIPRQIEYAIERLPTASHIKLYNSGNFFDPQAIPPSDFPDIAAACSTFSHVIVETHPKLCGQRVFQFQDLLSGTLEVAIGLETADPDLLAKLNKQMTLSDFATATESLCDRDILVRAFILLKPPFTSEQQAVELAIRSVEFALDCGVDCCVVIPTRRGNGAIDYLEQRGDFRPPSLRSLEWVADSLLPRYQGRVFVDLWDAGQFATCRSCATQRIARLHQMNLTQQTAQPVICDCDNQPLPWRN